MGYWGYKAMESDSALDAMFKVIALLEKMWDEATDYGQKMAVVYVLTEAPEVDGNDYRGLKAKASAYLTDYADMLENDDGTEFTKVEIAYLRELASKLQEKQRSTLMDKLTV